MTQSVSEAEASIDEADYQEIEAAVKATARGRAFLAEFLRRNRGPDAEAQPDQAPDQVAPQPGEVQVSYGPEQHPDLTEVAADVAWARLEMREPSPLAQRDSENTLVMETSQGQVVIALRPDLAPVHVTRIKELTREGFYDDVVFHRVIEGFMAQTGDPNGTGTGGSGKKLRAEFSEEPHVRGTCAMARTRDPDSADSQFFICFADAPWLDGRYTVWGQVVVGMESLDKLKHGDQGWSVSDPDRIVTLRVAADVENFQTPQLRKSG